MKRIFLAFLALLATVNTWAVKANPMPVEVRQSDGTMLTVILHGDEHFHYYTTADGVLLVQEGTDYFIAGTDDKGMLTTTRQLAHQAGKRSKAEQALIAKQDRQRFLETGLREATMHRAKQEPITATNFYPHQGSPKGIVILAEFTDTTFSISNPKLAFEEYFNSMEKLKDHGNGESANLTSVKKYFSDISFGQFNPEFDVYGPVKLPSKLKTYGGTQSNGRGERMDLLLQDACALMNDSLDFSQYDANDDGYVDLVVIIYAGYSESMGGNSNECIWPKAGTQNNVGEFDGKTVSRYAVSAELNGFPGCWNAEPFKRINGIGTFCHEFCHDLGLPDFYPTVNSVKGDNQAMEYWSLMDSGCYLINGYAPIALNAWEREAFGWIEIPTLTEDTDLQLRPLDDGGTAYRILNDNDASGKEYFLIENMQAIKHNSYLKGHGMIVYHVNYSASNFSVASNSVNNEKGKPRMTIVPADGLLFAQYNVGQTIEGKTITNSDFYNQLAGDPFPGTTKADALCDTTNVVNFQVYTGEVLNKAFTDINESEDGVVSLHFVNDFNTYTGITTADVRQTRTGRGPIRAIDGRTVGYDIHRLPKGLYIQDGRKILKTTDGE